MVNIPDVTVYEKLSSYFMLPELSFVQLEAVMFQALKKVHGDASNSKECDFGTNKTKNDTKESTRLDTNIQRIRN